MVTLAEIKMRIRTLIKTAAKTTGPERDHALAEIEVLQKLAELKRMIDGDTPK